MVPFQESGEKLLYQMEGQVTTRCLAYTNRHTKRYDKETFSVVSCSDF